MKIALLSVFPPFRGGISRFNQHLIKGIEASTHEVFGLNFSRQYPSLLFPGKSQYSDVQPEDHYPAVLDSINPLSWRRTAKLIEHLEAERLIIPYWTGYLAPALGSVARQVKLPVTGLLHNAIPHDAGRMERWLGRYFLRSCDDFVTLSQSVSDDLREEMPVASVKTLFHPVYTHDAQAAQPTQSEARASLGLSHDKRLLLFFGLIRPYKGLNTLIEAFNRLDDRYELVIAGEPYMDLKPLKAAASIDASKRIHWHSSFIPDHLVSAYFKACDAVVLPYHTATQSGVTAHALHFRKPVIASKVGGLSEAIRGGENGLLVAPGEAVELERAIQSWFEAPPPEGLVHSACSRMVEQLSWERFVHGLLSD